MNQLKEMSIRSRRYFDNWLKKKTPGKLNVMPYRKIKIKVLILAKLKVCYYILFIKL